MPYTPDDICQLQRAASAFDRNDPVDGATLLQLSRFGWIRRVSLMPPIWDLTDRGRLRLHHGPTIAGPAS